MSAMREIIALAATQGGVVRRDQLAVCGLSASAIGRRLKTRELTLVAKNVYQVIPPGGPWDLVRGAIVALPGAVVSHEAAAHLLRFPVLPELEPTVTVHRATTHIFPGVIVRRCDDFHPDHLTTVTGLPTTRPIRTLFDLAGVLSYRRFAAIGDGLVMAGRMEVQEYQGIVDEVARRGKRGTSYSRRFLAERGGADPNATPLERRGRSVLAARGLPSPLAQYPIPWNRTRRFDDAYPAQRLAIEWDSQSWHAQVQRMSADRERDRDALLHGWIILRFTSDDVKTRPDHVAEAVRRALEMRADLD